MDQRKSRELLANPDMDVIPLLAAEIKKFLFVQNDKNPHILDLNTAHAMLDDMRVVEKMPAMLLKDQMADHANGLKKAVNAE